MAQATGVETFWDCEVDYSDAGGAWTAIGGYVGSIAVSGGERTSGEAYTFEGDVSIPGTGKRQPYEATLRLAYTEGASDPYTVIRDAHRANTQFRIRWSPEGADTGEFLHTTSTDSRVISCPPPVGAAEDAAPAFIEFMVRCSDIDLGSAT